MKVLIVGLAKSGLAATRLLHDQGDRITIIDEKSQSHFTGIFHELPSSIETRFDVKRFSPTPYDLIVISPGVPWDHPDLVQARKNRIPVWSELELAWRFVQPFKT